MKTSVALSCRKGPGAPAGQELLSKIVEGNRGWLCPTMKKLAYTFSMKSDRPGRKWTASVEYAGPNDVTVNPCDGEAYRGPVDDSYDPYNCAVPPQLTTLLQGVTFFGPMHELLRNPKNYDLSLIGEETINGREAYVLHVRFSTQLDEQGAAEWDKELRKRAERDQYLYEFVPTEKQINGNKRVVVEVKCLHEKGPVWPDIMAAHRADPSCLRCGGRTIHATVREYRGKQRPVIVIGDDAGFEGKSRFTSKIFAGGVSNMTRG